MSAEERTGLRSGLDYSHPLHRASVAVEEAMYGEVKGGNHSGIASVEAFTPYLDTLLKQAGLDEVDAAEVMDDAAYYGHNIAHEVVGPGEAFVFAPLAYSIFLNGLMHGIALAGKIEPAEPRIKEGGAS